MVGLYEFLIKMFVCEFFVFFSEGLMLGGCGSGDFLVGVVEEKGCFF